MEVKDDPAGLVVVRVIAESFAQKRGVRAGDRIVKLPGSDRPRQNQFGQLLQWSHLTARPATITFSRDGETYEVVTASSPKASPPSDSLGTNGTNR